MQGSKINNIKGGNQMNVDFIKSKCSAMKRDIKEIEDGNNINLNRTAINLTALEFDDDALQYLCLGGIEETKAKELIANWKTKAMHCYGCTKMNCSEEHILQCQGQLKHNSEGQISNNMYDICSKHKLESLERETELEGEIDMIINDIIEGKKKISDNEIINLFAELSFLNKSKTDYFIKELADNNIPTKNLVNKITILKNKKDSLSEETERELPEILKPYKDQLTVEGFMINEEGELFEKVETTNGTLYKKIANGVPLVTGRIIKDDSVERISYYELFFIINGEQKTSSITIPAQDISSSQWLYTYLGTEVILSSNGMYDKLRLFIMESAKGIEETKMSYKLGWVKGENKQGYGFLYNGTCIGNDSINACVIPEFCAYKHIEAKSVNIKDAYKTLNMFMEKLIPDKPEITNVLFSHMLNSILLTKTRSLGIPCKFVIWLYGKSGSYKTELGKLLISFFGQCDVIPANFQDTPASLEKKCCLTSDCLLLIDDYAPSSSISEQRAKLGKANLITRNIGDRISKSRARSNMELAKVYFPNGNIIVTGENLIDGYSTLSRHFSINLIKGDVDVKILTKLQENKHKLAKFLEYFILYVKAHIMDKCDFDLLKDFKAYRDDFRNVKSHARFAEAGAQLMLSYQIFIQFLIDNKLISESEGTEMRNKFKHYVEMTIDNQNLIINSEEPVYLFIQALKQLIGGRELPVVNPNNISNEGQACIYREDNMYYLLPSLVYERVCGHLMRKGQMFNITERNLWKSLSDEKIIEVQEHKEARAPYKFKKQLGGTQVWCIKIKKETLDNI